jgi:hypothetical protein
MRRAILLPGIVLAAALIGAPARADERYNSGPAIAEHRWYGWQTLVADLAIQAGGGVAYGIGLAGDASDGVKNAISLSALGGWVVVSPIVHALHGHGGKAVGSAALRIGVPLVTGAAGATIGWLTSGESDKGAEDGAALGILAGVITVTILDAAVIAREQVYRSDPHPYGARPAPRLALALAPFAAPRAGGGTVGLTARF